MRIWYRWTGFDQIRFGFGYDDLIVSRSTKTRKPRGTVSVYLGVLTLYWRRK